MKQSVSFRRLVRNARDVIGGGRRDVFGATIDADPLSEPRQGGAQQGVALDVDFLAIGKCRLKLLRQDSGGRKPANQLQASLAQLIESALIESDLRRDVPKPPIDDGAALRHEWGKC